MRIHDTKDNEGILCMMIVKLQKNQKSLEIIQIINEGTYYSCDMNDYMLLQLQVINNLSRR